MDGTYGFDVRQKNDSGFTIETVLENVANAAKLIFGNSNPSKPADSFQKTREFEKRKAESARILQKYPDRIPVICEVSTSSEHAIILDKIKYLVPSDLTVGQFLHVIRKRVKQDMGTYSTKLTPDVSLFLYTEDSTLPPISYLIGQIYRENKNTDGFLYFTVSVESSFG